MERGRRLPRARALRRAYRLEIPPLRDLGLVQIDSPKLSGLLARAGSIIASQAKCSAPSSRPPRSSSTAANCKQRNQKRCQTQKSKPISILHHSHPGISGFEQEFGINPGTDIDAETDWTLRRADQEAELRHVNGLPAHAPGMRIGSPQYPVYREELSIFEHATEQHEAPAP